MTHRRKVERVVAALLDWFGANARDLPWRRRSDPYAIWVSEIMLQQTQVKTVLPYWNRWMKLLPTIVSLARADSRQIHKLWEGLGYYSRVRNMQAAARTIVAEHGGEFPREFQNVLALPGIGRYTAGAICSIAWNQPAPILDGNVIRVLARVFAVAGNPRDKRTSVRLWELAETLVQATDQCGTLNQSLMELGALVCKPRQPLCVECPLRTQCVAFRAGRVDELPELPARPATTKRRFAAFILERDGTYLVRQRPPGIVNGHLWEFPNAEINGEQDIKPVARKAIGVTPHLVERVGSIEHTITRYRITTEVYRAECAKLKSAVCQGRWVSARGLKNLPFSSAHKQVVRLAVAK